MNYSIEDTGIFNHIENQFGIVGRSGPFRESINLLLQAAPTDLAVLITGETGTGKEVFANAVHGLSNRKQFPFVSVNCSAIPETLLESELFGHEKGAFTGAVDSRKGFFETAHKGTIFLDEIGEMPIGTQVKLLRILESGEFSRLGSSSVHKVNVRIVAATNRDLLEEVDRGNFRRDLYYRLKNVNIVLPPLRSHPEDIPLLSEYFARRICAKIGIPYEDISTDALSILRSQTWTGNVRELKNLIDTVVSLESTGYITSDMLLPHLRRALPPPGSDPQPIDKTLVPIRKSSNSDNFELEIIFRTLVELRNDMSDIKRFISTLAIRLEDFKRDIDEKFDSHTEFKEIDDDPDDDLDLREMEIKLIKAALERAGNSRRIASKYLGISERTLYRKLNDYGLGNS